MADFDFTQKQFSLAEIYKITLLGSLVLPLANHGEDLTVDSITYKKAPITRGKIRNQANLEVDRLQISIPLRGLIIDEVEVDTPTLLRGDYFRNAKVQVYAVDPSDLVGVDPYLLWEGYVTGDISYNDGVLNLNTGSLLDKLNDKFPKIVYTEHCQKRLYSRARTGTPYVLCELDEDDWKDSGTVAVAGGSTRWMVVSTMFAYATRAATYFDQGKFYYGDLMRSIRYHGDGYVLLLSPLPTVPVDGSDIYASPGCNRSSKTCYEKFNNLAHFFGFEFIPRADVLNSVLD